jgi:hypothetical protein
MTRYDVAVLSLRLVALYVWLQTAIHIAWMALFLANGWGAEQGDTSHVSGWLLSIALLVAFGCALFFAAPALAGRMLPGVEPIQTAARPEIGALALRICALLVFAEFLVNLESVPADLQLTHLDLGWNPAHTKLLVTALDGCASVLLFVAAPWLSRRLFGGAGQPLEPALLAHVQAVAYSVLGLWLIASSLPTVARVAVNYIETGGYGPERPMWGEYALVALGLALFVGGQGLSAFWRWIRNAGLSSREQVPR